MRAVGVILAVLVTGAPALAGCGSSSSTSTPGPTSTPTCTPATPQRGLYVVHAAIGSEKSDFFGDCRVINALAADGFQVSPTYMGSRHMVDLAAKGDLSRYDVAFPASQPAAEAIQKEIPDATLTPVFSSPMAVATFTEIAQLLAREQGIASENHGTWIFHVDRFLGVAFTTSWDAIPENTAYPSTNHILLSTTDPSQSNSADMLVAIVSNVLNGGLVTDPKAVDKYARTIAQLFIDQGITFQTSQEPFDIYMTQDGMGRVPMTLVYEAQFIGREINDPASMGDRVLMYPYPTVYSDHTLVVLKQGQDKLETFARDLTHDPTLTNLEALHGFRNAQFSDVVGQHDIRPTPPTRPPSLAAVDVPVYEILEGFLNAIDKLYHPSPS
jgi:hypothetical protein